MVNIIINQSAARCEHCNQSADMNEDGHFTILGYVKNGEPGCGEVWSGVSSDYINIPEMMAATDEGYWFAENLRGLPVYSASSPDPIGVYGGPSRENEAVSEV